MEGFGRELKRVYGHPVGDFGQPERTDDDTLAISAPVPALTDRLVLTEDLTGGEHIRGFEVYAVLERGYRLLLYRGTTVGHKAICAFPPIRAARFEVKVTGHDGDWIITSIHPYLT